MIAFNWSINLFDGRMSVSNGVQLMKGCVVPCRAALACATASSGEIGTVCVHGTGTPLGDPIEIGALGQGLKRSVGHSSSILILSNKSCFGHTEGTAGLSGTYTPTIK